VPGGKLEINPAKSKAAPMSACSFLDSTIRGTFSVTPQLQCHTSSMIVNQMPNSRLSKRKYKSDA